MCMQLCSFLYSPSSDNRCHDGGALVSSFVRTAYKYFSVPRPMQKFATMFVEVMADGMTVMVEMEPHATKLRVVPGELSEA